MRFDLRALVHCVVRGAGAVSEADTIRRLRDELDEAHETIRQLRRQLAPYEALPDWVPPLTPVEDTLMRHLLARDLVTAASFSAAIPLDALKSHEGDEDKRIKAYVFRLREILAPIGVRIRTVWGRGYALDRSTLPAAVHQAAVQGAAA